MPLWRGLSAADKFQPYRRYVGTQVAAGFTEPTAFTAFSRSTRITSVDPASPPTRRTERIGSR